MKIILSLSLLLATASAFSPAPHSLRTTTSTQLEATSRRDMIQAALVGGVAFLSAQQASAEPRATWLVEPTA